MDISERYTYEDAEANLPHGIIPPSKEEELEDIKIKIAVYENVKAQEMEKLEKIELGIDGIDSRLSRLKAQKMLIEKEIEVEMAGHPSEVLNG